MHFNSLNYTSSLGVFSCMAERASEAGKIRLGVRSPISTPKLGPLDPNSPPGFERCLSISSASTRTRYTCNGFERCLSISSASTRTVILDVAVLTDSAPSKPHLSPPRESTKSESASFMKNDAQTVAKALHAHRKKLQILYTSRSAQSTRLRTRGSQLSAYQVTAI